jgi:hypothetical protein
MATYSITINEKSQTGKNLLNLLKSMDVVKIEKTITKVDNVSREEFLSDLKESVYQAKNNISKPLKQLFDGD